MGDAEDGGGCRHAERERRQRGQGEGGSSQEPAPGMHHVARRLIEPLAHAHLPDPLFQRIETSHVHQHDAPRMGRRLAGPHPALDLLVDPRLKLGVEIVVEAAPLRHRPPHARQAREQSHCHSVSSTSRIASTSRAQSRVPDASCRRPAAVRR